MPVTFYSVTSAAEPVRIPVNAADGSGVNAGSISDSSVFLRNNGNTFPTTIDGSPNTSVSNNVSFDALWRFDSFAAADNGVYEVIVSGITDGAGNVRAEQVYDTITLDIGGAPPTAGPISFAGLSSMPAGFTTSGSALIQYLADRIVIPASSGNAWFNNYAESNRASGDTGIVWDANTDVYADFTSGPETAVGLSIGAFGHFNADSSLVLFGDGSLWSGAGVAIQTNTFAASFGAVNTGQKLRLRYNNVSNGEVDVSLSEDTGSGFTLISTLRVSIPANLLAEARFYFDAKETDISIYEVKIA